MRAGWRSAAAALGVFALAGITACGADASVAAYVDNHRITEAEVDEVVDELEGILATNHQEALAGLEAQLQQRVSEDGEFTEDDAAQQLADAEQQQAEELADQLVQLRDQVVEMRIMTEAAAEYADDEGLEVAESPVEAIAEQAGLSPEVGFVRVAADFSAAMGALQSSVEPAAPSEADQREVYDQLVEAGVVQGMSFEQAQQELTQEAIGEQVGMRDTVAEAVQRADITVNPRYDLVHQVQLPLGNVQVALGVPLGGSAVAEAG